MKGHTQSGVFGKYGTERTMNYDQSGRMDMVRKVTGGQLGPLRVHSTETIERGLPEVRDSLLMRVVDIFRTYMTISLM